MRLVDGHMKLYKDHWLKLSRLSGCVITSRATEKMRIDLSITNSLKNLTANEYAISRRLSLHS